MDERTAKGAEDIAARLGLDRSVDRHRSRRRLFVVGAAGLAALAVLGFLFFRPKPQHYVTDPVARGALTITVSATGTLKPLNQVDVGAEISGRIVALNADFNDHVTKDEVIALLDTAELKAHVVQSEANVANGQATLKETGAKRDRVIALRRTGTSSKEDRDIAQAAFERAAAALKQAEALLEIDRTNLSHAEIRSPIDGIVLDRKVEVGQTVASVFQTPVLFTIAEDLTRMRLHVDIDEADVGRVQEGESAGFSVDAYPERRFAARVHEFRHAPHTNEGVVTYEAVLDVENPDLALRPGMTANVDIIATRINDAVTISNGALRFTPPGYAYKQIGDKDGLPIVSAVALGSHDGAPPSAVLAPGQGIVWTLDEGKPVPHAVRVGASDSIRSVLEGNSLAPGTGLLIDVERKPDSGQAR